MNVPSASRISVSSAKHADPQVAVCSLAGRNIVSRSISSSLEWGWRRSRPLCSPFVGSGWPGPIFRVRLVLNTLILSSYCRFSPHPIIWSVRRIASKLVCPGCVGIWRSMACVRGFPRIRSLWGSICVFRSQGVYLFVWWSMTLTHILDRELGLAGCVASL